MFKSYRLLVSHISLTEGDLSKDDITSILHVQIGSSTIILSLLTTKYLCLKNDRIIMHVIYLKDILLNFQPICAGSLVGMLLLRQFQPVLLILPVFFRSQNPSI